MSHEEGGDKSSSLLERLRERAEWERTHEEMDSPYAQLVSAAADRIEHLEAELYDTPRSSVAENDLGDLTQACVEEFEKSLGRNLPGRQTAIIRKHIEKALSLRSATAKLPPEVNELAAMAGDARRYRWIRKRALWRAGFEEQSVTWDVYMSEPDIREGKLTDDSVALELDAGIDAAMRGEYVDGGSRG